MWPVFFGFESRVTPYDNRQKEDNFRRVLGPRYQAYTFLYMFAVHTYHSSRPPVQWCSSARRHNLGKYIYSCLVSVVPCGEVEDREFLSFLVTYIFFVGWCVLFCCF